MMKPIVPSLLLAVIVLVFNGCNDRLIPPDGAGAIWSGRAMVYNGFDIFTDTYGPIYIQQVDDVQSTATQAIPTHGYVTYPGRGGAFLYVADEGFGPSLYIHDKNGERVLANRPGGSSKGKNRAVAVLSNDGGDVAYLQRELSFPDSALFLYTVSIADTSVMPVRAPMPLGEVRSMMFSPDEKYIAISIVNDDGLTEDVHIFDRTSGQITAQIGGREADIGLVLEFIYWFQWMPDSRGIIYRGMEPWFGLGIFIATVDGLSRQPVAIGGEYSFPAPSPTDGRIAAIRNNQLWLMNADGSSPRQVMKDSLGDSEVMLGPQWSADGAKILINRADINPFDPKSVVEVVDVATGRCRALAQIVAPGLWLE